MFFMGCGNIRSAVIFIPCVEQRKWIKLKNVARIFSSPHVRRAVRIFCLMSPAGIHSNITAKPANFRFVFVSFEDGGRWVGGVLALMDDLKISSCGCVSVLRCTGMFVFILQRGLSGIDQEHMCWCVYVYVFILERISLVHVMNILFCIIRGRNINMALSFIHCWYS